MQKITSTITGWLRSPKFFRVIIGIFLLQGVFLALAVEPSYIEIQPDGYESRGGGVVPDGNRHIGAIYYFAERPLLTSPFVADQEDRDLWMGDLERFPSYLYYWLLSIPVKLALLIGAPDPAIILIIRFIGLLFGILVLVVFRKIARELRAGEVVANLSGLALALTGSFVWLAPSENYDIPSLLTFFLFTLATVRLLARNDGRQVYWMTLWLLIGGITKYTYIPFMGLMGLIAVSYYVQKNGCIRIVWQRLTAYLSKVWRTRTWLAIGATVLLIVSAGLFVERIGGNMLHYQAFNPNCAEIHSHEACMDFGVYKRNYDRKTALEDGTAIERYSYEPVSYTGMWIERYFSSLYAYMGHIWIEKFWPVMFIGGWAIFIAAVTMIAYLKFKRQRILGNVRQKLIAFMAVVFVVMQYLFNVRTYINFEGMTYAHQGRYLLAAIAFVYILLAIVAVKFVRLQSDKVQKIIVPILVAISLLAVVTTSAMPVWFAHVDREDWYSQPFKFLAR